MKKHLLFTTLLFLALGVRAQTYTSSPGATIPDDSCDATNEFTQDLAGEGLSNIDGTFGLETVELNINHTWVSDLDIYLVAPDGTEVELSTDNGGSGEDYTATVFDMAAGTDITAGSAPFTGSFVPEGVLGGVNNGQDPNGLWTLRACDDDAFSEGTLIDWSITFSNNPAPPPVIPPANNNCSSAAALTLGSSCTNTIGTNVNATASGETPNPSCSLFGGGMDVWYSVIVPACGNINIEMSSAGGPSDWAMAVYSGACGGLAQVECDDDDGVGNFPLIELTGQTAGATLLIRVWEYNNNETGEFNICAFAPTPTNDACAGATVVDNGSAANGNTGCATDVDNLSPCNGGGGGGDCTAVGDGTTDFSEGVWFKYTSSTNGETITASTDNAGTDFDTEIIVYQGACGALTCVGGDDDGGTEPEGDTFDSKFCWVSTASLAPVDYFIYVNGHGGATGNYAFTLTVVDPPLPIDLISFEGDVMENYNMLSWETSSEENTEAHIIERSIDGRDNWEVIGAVDAVGYTYEENQYKLEDRNPIAKAYYRLKSVDFDGSSSYSDIILLERKISSFEIVNISPNPARTSVSIDFQVPQNSQYTIRMTNMIGQIVYLEQMNLNAGVYSNDINIAAFTNGVYFITIENGLESLVHKIVKQ